MKINWFAVALIVLQVSSSIYAGITGDIKVALLAFLYAVANCVLYFM